jgi:hypothetical protein
MIDVRDKASRLARRGLPVFPCLDNKAPAVRSGFRAASTEPQQIRDWEWEGMLIGVPTSSQSSIAVLDIDPRHGGDEFTRTHANRLVARTHLTRSGGLHLLFRTDGSIRNSAGLIAPGVDVRGEGGYIIWWPAHGFPVLNFLPLAELPDWPGWLTPERVWKPRHGTGKRGGRIADPYQVAVLVKFVRESREGERNVRLFWAACRLAELKFINPHDQFTAISKLRDAATLVGLSGEEAQVTIESGLSR